MIYRNETGVTPNDYVAKYGEKLNIKKLDESDRQVSYTFKSEGNVEIADVDYYGMTIQNFKLKLSITNKTNIDTQANYFDLSLLDENKNVIALLDRTTNVADSINNTTIPAGKTVSGYVYFDNYNSDSYNQSSTKDMQVDTSKIGSIKYLRIKDSNYNNNNEEYNYYYLELK